MQKTTMKLNDEEKYILDEYEQGNLNVRKPQPDEIDQIKSVASNTLKKDRRITIRLYDHNYKGIKKKAMEMGIPYHTLISGMIHRYIEGDLVEKSKQS
jgi:predicted DNA binding CopG/RHH family protein